MKMIKMMKMIKLRWRTVKHFRSSSPEVFWKMIVIKNFVKSQRNVYFFQNFKNQSLLTLNSVSNVKTWKPSKKILPGFSQITLRNISLPGIKFEPNRKLSVFQMLQLNVVKEYLLWLNSVVVTKILRIKSEFT